jgi:hypothetical protein
MGVLLPGTLVNILMDVCVSFRGRIMDFPFMLKKFLFGYFVLNGIVLLIQGVLFCVLCGVLSKCHDSCIISPCANGN